MGAWVYVWTRSESQDPAGVCRVQLRQEGRRAGIHAGAAAFCDRSTRVCNSEVRDPVCICRNPEVWIRIAARFVNSIRKLNEMLLDPTEIRRSRRASTRLKWHFACVERTGIDGSFKRAKAHSRFVWRGARQAVIANNCLLARRLVERGVRFVQLYHEAWDQHGNLVKDITIQLQGYRSSRGCTCARSKQRGMLDTRWCVGLSSDGHRWMQGGNDGRDHHPMPSPLGGRWRNQTRAGVGRE